MTERPGHRKGWYFGAVGAIVVVAATSGCVTTSSRTVVQTQPGQSSGPSHSPTSAGLTAAGRGCRQHFGGSVSFRDPANHTVMRVGTKTAQLFSGRLASYASAYPPTHGHFVKIPISVTNVGPGLLPIKPTWFVLHAGGLSLTVEDGSGPYSGASHQLVATFLSPGDTDRTNIVIDTPSTHGRLEYRPKGKLGCSWTF